MPVLDLGGVVGRQDPTVSHWPAYECSPADDAIELAERAGLVLDPWQRTVLEHSLGVRPDGQWASFEVGLEVPRQNGKGAILEALELACLFIFEDRLTVHSAHLFDTSLEAMNRLLFLIENTPDLDRQVKRKVLTNGKEGIELTKDRRIRFRSRTKGGGRGFSGDKVILDEAMFLPESMIGALMPTVSARPTPQIWYVGSAVDWQLPNPDGVVFSRLRERGHKGDDPRLTWMEWSADPDGDPDDTEEIETDPDAWARSNPGLGIRISHEYVESEQRSMANRTFAVERLGIGDWPDTAGNPSVLDLEKWSQMEDKTSQPGEAVCFAADVTPDRSSGSIGVAGRRPDGLWHIEIAKHGKGTNWLVPELVRMVQEHPNIGLKLDATGPVASLMGDLDAKGVKYDTVNAQEHARACGLLFDTVEQMAAKHLSQRELTSAIKGADKRPLGDAWAWSRKSSAVDISPLVAVTLALWGAEQAPRSEPGFEVLS